MGSRDKTEELTEGDLHLQSLKTGIVWHGLFSSDYFFGTDSLYPPSALIVKMYRRTLDFCLVDIMDSDDAPARVETLKWMETEGFDEFCYLAQLEPTYVLKIMDTVFKRYKKTTEGREWNCPNLDYVKVDNGPIIEIDMEVWCC